MSKTNKFVLIAIMLCFFVIGSLHAQTTRFLSENHVMQRVPTDAKYLLLPVEESRENDHIRVIQNCKVVKEFNCRLAADKTDYFVPLQLDEFVEGEILLDITMARGNADAAGGQTSLKDFVCWKQMQCTNTFDTQNRENFRPVYHHTPRYGWMNDPNGMFYKDGVWHLYFQHNPYGSQWENMTWGHSTSRDLMHWTHEVNALEPDALGTIFSGSAVVDKNNTAGFGRGAVVAMYTSAGQNQTQSLAYSTDDGKTFTKYAGNPVLMSNVPDFRDPNVFWNEDLGQWNMILAEGQHMKIYSSPNLKDWTHESDFGEGYGSHDGVWECPDLIRMGDRWLLICNINPGGPFGGSATQYFIGTFDGHKFVCEDAPEETKWMDWGKDHYATVTFSNAPDGRCVAMPWMSNWQYANQVPTRQYRSANGLPRDLGLFSYRGETYCSVKPSREVMDAFSAKPVKQLTEACRIDVRLRNNTVITLSNAQGENVTMTYNAAKETFEMDRTKSGDTSFSNDFATVTQAPTRGKIRTLQIFIDKSSIEVFDADGKMAMSNIVFPSSPYTKLSVKGGKARIYDLK
ncbi:MAG: DUF4980 domain-containing protein [Prevotella sp.]|jgi:fructan beta-fructosidase